MRYKIAPSILSAKREILQKEVKEIEPFVELLHVDIMDGKFVPPTTFRPDEIKAVRTKLPKDVHLMVERPLTDGFIDDYIDAGASSITVHVEGKDSVKECLAYLKMKKIGTAVSINPHTPLEKLLPFLDEADMVLIMSVNPGYAAQSFIPEVLGKVKELRKLKPKLDIEIDGGISKDTIKQAKDAGANVFVAGNAIFNKPDRKAAIKELREALK